MKNIFLILALAISLVSMAQDSKKISKYEAVSSKYGTFTKGAIYDVAPVEIKKMTDKYVQERFRGCIHKVESENTNNYFAEITHFMSREFSSTALIEYTDLKQLYDAIQMLKAEANSRELQDASAVTGLYTTIEGVSVKYRKGQSGVSWIITLDQYSSDIIMNNDISYFDSFVKSALDKIESIK